MLPLFWASAAMAAPVGPSILGFTQPGASFFITKNLLDHSFIETCFISGQYPFSEFLQTAALKQSKTNPWSPYICSLKVAQIPVPEARKRFCSQLVTER
uniref:Putative secreted protein n=1 Tax=Ixodes ricinus TaxID=34613 RepID=A0A6B0UGC3_IXORI